jgi:calcineurin-like phosphoesterase family protein
MAEVFLISDLHLGHKNILTFMHDGKPLRPFKTLEEMHEVIVTNWNKIVTSQDKIYVLGDVAMNDWGLSQLDKCNGHKRLVMGNHDKMGWAKYIKREGGGGPFEEIYGVRQINGVWMTHVPMHVDSVAQPRVIMNAHGHLHANKVKGNFSKKYFNCCVEQLNYTPVSIDEIK